MDCKSEISTRYDMFLVLQRFHGILNIKMPEQSLFWASNVWNKFLVSAHKINNENFKNEVQMQQFNLQEAQTSNQIYL